jgi:hypothetical protein
MTTKTAEISTIVLKNADPDATNKVLANLVRAEIKRRPHLRDGLDEIKQTDDALNIKVIDEGVMQHLANALSLDVPVEQIIRLIGKAYGRTGKVGTLTVTVWYIEF